MLVMEEMGGEGSELRHNVHSKVEIPEEGRKFIFGDDFLVGETDHGFETREYF